MAAVAAFSPDGALFATIAGNAVRVFDTGNGRLKVVLTQQGRESAAAGGAAQAPVEPYRCIAWGQDGQPGGVLTGRRQLLLAVGTSSGAVVAYDVSAAEQLWRTQAIPDGDAIKSLGFASLAAGPAFLALGGQSSVTQLSAATGAVEEQWEGSKHLLTAIRPSPSNGRCFLAGASVDIWDLAAKTRVHRFSGHTVPAQVAACTHDGTFAVSAGAGERSLAVWDASGPPSKKRRAAAGLLTTDSPVIALEMHLIPDTGAMLLAATLEEGGVVVWHYDTGLQGSERSNQSLRLRVKGDGHVAIKLDVGVDGAASVMVATHGARPKFDRFAVPAGGLPAADAAIVASQTANDRVSAAVDPAAGRAAVVMLSADDAADLTSLRPIAAVPTSATVSPALGKRARTVNSADAGDMPSAAGDNVGTHSTSGGVSGLASDADEEEAHLQTIGDRVAALPRGFEDTALTDATTAAQPAEDETITADSLSVLLSQALHSQDRALLERCFSVSSGAVISNTIRRLSAPDAVLLLRAAIQRLQSRPLRGEQLQHWIRAVLVCHTAYLISAPGAQAALVALYQTIQARTSWHEPLLSLSGRMELVRAQRTSSAESAEALKPMMEYFESDTDDATDSEHVASEASDEGGLPSGDDEASDDASDSGNETSEDVMSE